MNKIANKVPFSGIAVMNWGMGILFFWGGVEKFVKDFGIGFAGFPGGVGLDGMSGFLGQIGFGFLGETGLLALAVALAVTEIITGLCLLFGKKTQEAAAVLAFIILVALALAHAPSGNWMNIMIHLALLTSLTGMALTSQK